MLGEMQNDVKCAQGTASRTTRCRHDRKRLLREVGDAVLYFGYLLFFAAFTGGFFAVGAAFLPSGFGLPMGLMRHFLS